MSIPEQITSPTFDRMPMTPARLRWSVTQVGDTLVMSLGDELAAVEIPGELRVGVEIFMQANGMSGPTISVIDSVVRSIHVVTGTSKVDRAAEYLRNCGALIHVGQAAWQLSPGGVGARWSATGGSGDRIPPLVAVAAGVRAVLPIATHRTALTALFEGPIPLHSQSGERGADTRMSVRPADRRYATHKPPTATPEIHSNHSVAEPQTGRYPTSQTNCAPSSDSEVRFG